MFLSKLILQDFRNYSKRLFDFDSGTTVIVGPNTIGKTNILEAIFLLSTGKSFRAEKDLEMIRFGSQIGRVTGETQNSNPKSQNHNANLKTEIILTTGQVQGKPAPRKKYIINGVSRRQIDFVGNLRTVLFEPTDLELVTDSPSLRRKYLDFVLIQVDREYRRALLSYEKGLRQRNKLLERIRDEGVSRGQLHFWNELLIKNGQTVSLKRREFINFVNYYQKDFGQLELVYNDSEISQERLLKYQNEEIASAQTLVGPHRDDWSISKQLTDNSKQLKTDGLDMALFGSRGEQRLAILWLKMAELAFVTEKTGERPVLLLDDIFSELDENHRELIMKIVPKQQTIITTTDLDHIGKEFLDQVKVINLEIDK